MGRFRSISCPHSRGMHNTPPRLGSFQSSTPQFHFQWRSFCELVLSPVQRLGALRTRSVARRWWWWSWALGRHSDASSARTQQTRVGDRGEGEIQCGFLWTTRANSAAAVHFQRNERKLDTMMELAWQLATPPLQTFGDKAILLISLSLSPQFGLWQVSVHMTLLKLCAAMHAKRKCKH